MLIHGSSDDGSGIHLLANALRSAGASTYVPVMRGHGTFGRPGDVDHVGQLEEDLVDLVTALRSVHPNGSFSLIGFSSGGGFVLRVMAGGAEPLFDRFVMIAPALPPGAPTIRPGVGHIGMTTSPEGTAAVRESFLHLTSATARKHQEEP